MRRASLLIALLCASACGFTTEPRLRDIDVARARWLESRPAAYSFEVAVATSWGAAGYHRMTVVGDSVTSVVDENGAPAPRSWAISIEQLWEHVLAVRTSGELNSAVFSQVGVPLETDSGRWEFDGGVHYSVRNYLRVR
jgi:hypothetical protein